MRFIAEGHKHQVKEAMEVDMMGIRRGAVARSQEVPWFKNPSVVTMIVVGAIVAVFALNLLGYITLPI